MIRPRILALTGTLLLLGVTSAAALATPISAHAATGDPSRQSRALLVAHSYLATFNADMLTGDFSSLVSMFAPNATLTMYSALPGNTSRDEVDQAHGTAAIARIFGTFHAAFAGHQWGPMLVLRATATQVVSVERARSPYAGYPPRMETVFTIRGGQIRRLDWTVYFGHQE
jgi:hypothetical protein